MTTIRNLDVESVLDCIDKENMSKKQLLSEALEEIGNQFQRKFPHTPMASIFFEAADEIDAYEEKP